MNKLRSNINTFYLIKQVTIEHIILFKYLSEVTLVLQ